MWRPFFPRLKSWGRMISRLKKARPQRGGRMWWRVFTIKRKAVRPGRFHDQRYQHSTEPSKTPTDLTHLQGWPAAVLCWLVAQLSPYSPPHTHPPHPPYSPANAAKGDVTRQEFTGSRTEPWFPSPATDMFLYLWTQADFHHQPTLISQIWFWFMLSTELLSIKPALPNRKGCQIESLRMNYPEAAMNQQL